MLPPRLVDAAIVCGVMALALVARLPGLWNYPPFTDEWDEIGVSIAIARGEAFPLTNVNAILGAWPSYLMAGWFALFGTTWYAPRLFTTMLACATVIPTYLLARELALAMPGWSVGWARAVGASAALLLAFSSAHVFLNSHLAWAISTTPLYTTSALWLLVAAVQAKDRAATGWRVVGAAFMLALALQTHISVLAILPGIALAVVVSAPWVFRTRWLPSAIAAFALGYSNMIVYNLVTGFDTLALALDKSAGYAGSRESTYLSKLADLLESFYRLIDGALLGRPRLADYLTDPFLIFACATAVVGIALLATRQQLLPLAATLSIIVVMPLVNNRYEPILSGRYLGPLLPVAFAGIAIAACTTARRVSSPLGRVVLAAMPIVLVAGSSMWQLQVVYTRFEATGRSNQRFFEAMAIIREHRWPDEPVILDARLARRRVMDAGAGEMHRVFRGVLAAERIPHEIQTIDDGWRADRPALVVLAVREQARTTNEQARALGLRSPDGGPPPTVEEPALFAVYRTAPNPR